MIQIVLADDHKLFRDGLRKILELDPEVKVVGEASNGEEALQLLQERSPDIILFDINMPRMDGIQLASSTRPTRRSWPWCAARRQIGRASCRERV